MIWFYDNYSPYPLIASFKYLLNCFQACTTKKATIYDIDSKSVLENRLKKVRGGIFVIKWNITTTFVKNRLWWGMRNGEMVILYSGTKTVLSKKPSLLG